MPPAQHPPLPEGLDPVAAGRAGLWLLAKREQAKAARRVAFPRRVCSDTLAARFVRLFLPWSVQEYPGYRRWLAQLLNVSEGRARNVCVRSGTLPRIHALTMSRYLRDHAAQCEALARQLEQQADEALQRAIKPASTRQRR